MTYQALAEQCGFGSIDSMKRAVKAKTGCSINDWRRTLPKDTHTI